MVVAGTDKLYKDYMKQESFRWEFGNSILYQMCKDNPKHDQADVVVGKIWLIGRSYAAAIERRKNADDFLGDDFWRPVRKEKVEQTLGIWEFMAISCQNWEHP